MPNRPVVDVAYREMVVEFTENCESTVPAEVMDSLERYFSQTVGRLLEDRKIEWDGRARRFCISAAASLGREVSHAAGTGSLTSAHFDEALIALVPYWERICPLPPVQDGEPQLLKLCLTLRTLLPM